ncbi:MAG: T9SS type A sorting domain-containing protein [bacterium]
MKNIFLFFLFLIINFINYAEAVEPRDHVIFSKVDIDTSGKLKAIISWDNDTNAKDYRIKRKLPADEFWTVTLAELDSNALTYTDTTIESGICYEYFLMKNCSFPTDTTMYTYEGYGYLFVGSLINVPDHSGVLLLLVDNTVADSLRIEIDRFIEDLTGDGWQVIRRDVPRTEEFDGKGVKKIKELIVEEYYKSNGELSSLLLLGRIAVPYSGDYAVDGHDDHKGAWVADTYYADIDGEWTDESINDTMASRQANRNIPGDGKFDQNQIPTDVELQTGRIDFYNLNYFERSEIELLRKYLNKNHDYRHGTMKPDYIGIVDDNFGMYGDVFASTGWMEFSGLLGPNNVQKGEFMVPLGTNPRLLAYGCGPGSYRNISAVVHLEELDTVNAGAVFSQLLGSFNGDWDVEDNILRSLLAYSPFALTCSWTGRPYWHFHHLGMGYPIGYSTKVSQNNQILYESNGRYGYRFVHVSLLGDPTLRMHVVEPAENLYLSSEVSMSGSKVFLTWEAGEDGLIGFNIYRSDDIFNKFVKINNEIITKNEFKDNNPLTGRNIYMVRAVRHTETATGSLINMSQGIFAETELPTLSYASKLDYSLKCYPNPAETSTNISYVAPKKERVDVSIWDLDGKLVKEIANSILNPGYYLYSWDLTNNQRQIVQSGIYLIKFTTNNKSIVAKLNVIR